MVGIILDFIVPNIVNVLFHPNMNKAWTHSFPTSHPVKLFIYPHINLSEHKLAHLAKSQAAKLDPTGTIIDMDRKSWTLHLCCGQVYGEDKKNVVEMFILST